MTETQQTGKKHHTTPPPTIASRVWEYFRSPWMRGIVLVLAGALMLGLAFNPLRSALVWLGHQITALPQQWAQSVEEQVYPPVTIDDFIFSGMQYADDHSIVRHLKELLQQQEAAATVVGLDIDALGQGLTQHPWIVAARVSRLHTGQILLSLQEQTPRALYISPQKEYWLINESGQAFVRMAKERVSEFSTLLRLSGDHAADFLPELLAVQAQVPEAFINLVRADRMRYSGWKLYYQRQDGGRYYVYVHGKNAAELVSPMQRLAMLEQRYQLSARAVRGYDLRAWPKVRVDLLTKG